MKPLKALIIILAILTVAVVFVLFYCGDRRRRGRRLWTAQSAGATAAHGGLFFTNGGHTASPTRVRRTWTAGDFIYFEKRALPSTGTYDE